MKVLDDRVARRRRGFGRRGAPARATLRGDERGAEWEGEERQRTPSDVSRCNSHSCVLVGEIRGRDVAATSVDAD
jgi:hypothetical protein